MRLFSASQEAVVIHRYFPHQPLRLLADTFCKTRHISQAKDVASLMFISKPCIIARNKIQIKYTAFTIILCIHIHA